MTISTRTITPASGIPIPVLGLGTFDANQDSSDKGMNKIAAAIKAGYRHLDTAALYGSEEDVGKGIRKSGIDRKELFVCTKL